MSEVTKLFRELHAAEDALKAHDDDAATKRAMLAKAVSDLRAKSKLTSDGLDLQKIDVAMSILMIDGLYANAGDERSSCVADAIKQLASGAPLPFKDLWKEYFGTKRYDGWYGQRSDHPYGYGPRHGSILFRVGLTDNARSRKQSELTSDEVEAAVYYLANIERIELARSVSLTAAE